MTMTGASKVVAVLPGEGRTGTLIPGIGVDFKLWGADTGGQLAIVEHPFAVGAVVGAHLHTREDEFSIVLEGEIGFRSEDEEVVLGPGGYIVKPRNQVHAMWNAGKVPARMIEVISPCGFENFFRDLVDRTDVGEVEMDAVTTLAEDYGLELHDPPWMPDVLRRYGLGDPLAG